MPPPPPFGISALPVKHEKTLGQPTSIVITYMPNSFPERYISTLNLYKSDRTQRTPRDDLAINYAYLSIIMGSFQKLQYIGVVFFILDVTHIEKRRISFDGCDCAPG